jgi:acyl carrier protein
MPETAADTITETVKRILADITHDESAVGMGLETRLREELGIDSMTSLTFLMALEDEIPGFTVDAGTLEAEHFQTIGSICGYVRLQTGADSAV